MFPNKHEMTICPVKYGLTALHGTLPVKPDLISDANATIFVVLPNSMLTEEPLQGFATQPAMFTDSMLK